jgi:hypothetical protein
MQCWTSHLNTLFTFTNLEFSENWLHRKRTDATRSRFSTHLTYINSHLDVSWQSHCRLCRYNVVPQIFPRFKLQIFYHCTLEIFLNPFLIIFFLNKHLFLILGLLGAILDILPNANPVSIHLRLCLATCPSSSRPPGLTLSCTKTRLPILGKSIEN